LKKEFLDLIMKRFSNIDKAFMGIALQQAKECIQRGEVPIGAVVVLPCGTAVARGNAQVRLHDALAHAEIRALNAACYAPASEARTYTEYGNNSFDIKTMGEEMRLRRRLDGSTLYVTVEPCLMCLGACLLHRVDRVIFGAKSAKFGAISGGSGCFYDSASNLRSKIDEAFFGDGIQWPSIPNIEKGEQEPVNINREDAKAKAEKRGGGVTTSLGQHYNHQLHVQGGCEGEESVLLMRNFFKEKRGV
jgi:tRNA(adenine34) deaminase